MLLFNNYKNTLFYQEYINNKVDAHELHFTINLYLWKIDMYKYLLNVSFQNLTIDPNFSAFSKIHCFTNEMFSTLTER